MIRIGIVGYGNVGRGVEKAASAAPDMALKAIFTRRDPNALGVYASAPVYDIDLAESMAGDIDVMLLCGGSATDLAAHGPRFAATFNIVDSFDNHSKIPEYLETLARATNNTTAVISTGWDPGLFSLMRALSEAVLPDGATYTFWGRGVSQGHSDAVRRVKGVKDAIQYTIPLESAVESARSGNMPKLEASSAHVRECHVVAEQGADKNAIEEAIRTMPNYFAGYDTTVNFVDEQQLKADHSGMPHGGLVLRHGKTCENSHVMELSLKLESNPEFTGSVMLAYARAALRMSREGNFGAKTVFDIPIAYLSEKSRSSLIKQLL